jgi:hypothetical protein
MANFTDRLLERFEPWMTPDLEGYLTAIGTMFSEVDLYVGDDDTPQWGILLDPDRAPLKALPYLAQYMGERLEAGLTEAQMREWIKDAPHQKRGTMESIFLAAQRHLTGSRSVYWSERDNGTATDQPDHLSMATLPSETPDAAVTLQDILSVAPADIEVHYSILPGQTWAEVDAGFADWAAADTEYATWAEMASDSDWPNVFSRPAP